MGFTAGYKVNENTQYEFTVSNETLQEVVSDTGISESDIADYCYTALVDSRINQIRAEPIPNYAETFNNPQIESWRHEYNFAYITDSGSMQTGKPLINENVFDTSDTVYERNFLIWSGTIYPNTAQEKTGDFLVMDMVDIKNFYLNYDEGGGFSTDTVESTPELGIGYTGTVYKYISNTYSRAVMHTNNNDPLLNPDCNIRVCNILVIDSQLWIGELNPSTHGPGVLSISTCNYANYTTCSTVGAFHTGDWESTVNVYQKGDLKFMPMPSNPETEFPACPEPWYTQYAFSVYLEVNDGMLWWIHGKWGQQNYASDIACEYDCITTQEANQIKWQSWCGLMFKHGNVTYKPIIQQGVIVGYSSDMDTPSEYDDMTNVTGNNISPVPPGPVPPSVDDEDNDDPVSTTGAPFSSGLCHYYALTAGSVLLEHISEALGTWDIENTHKDLYKNLVSCKLVKPPAAIPTTGSEPFTIYGVKPQYQGADITLPVVTGNPDASFGPYSIDRKFGDFRDYAPYTRVSIYLPCCGWCDLPSHVVGKSVSVKYFTDIIAATCKAVVFCGNNIIAEAAGVIGLDIPFVADNVGAKMQAVTAGMIAALGGGIQLGAGIGTMVSTRSGSGAKAALSGASQYLSGYSQMAMAFNENTTEISGKNGDGCCISGATNIIIKIVRPKKGAYTTAPYVPPGYGHNIGFVSQKQVRVGNVSGLLIADNVDTSGISGATEAERAEIKRVLETGLIVNAAPE